MRNPLLIIDDAVFRIFQPIVDRFPNAGPPGVARFFITGDFIACLADEVLQKAYFWMALNIILCSAIYILAEYPKIRAGLINSRRHSERFMRYLLILLVPVQALSLVSDLSLHGALRVADGLLFTMYAYTVACDVNPPRRKQSVWERRAVHA